MLFNGVIFGCCDSCGICVDVIFLFVVMLNKCSLLICFFCLVFYLFVVFMKYLFEFGRNVGEKIVLLWVCIMCIFWV